jgi:quercetin dioxygenase-like cupin family protein
MFTGEVAMQHGPAGAGGVSVVLVHFSPGARTRWHAHPGGQFLYGVSGRGRVRARGRPGSTIEPGDVVWIAPGVRHWHGATATTGMSHIAITEQLDGRNTEWMEKVSDEQYRR